MKPKNSPEQKTSVLPNGLLTEEARKSLLRLKSEVAKQYRKFLGEKMQESKKLK